MEQKGQIMIRIAVCEDNPKHLQSIVELLEEYQKTNHEEFKITTYRDGIDLVSDFAFQFDIIFLDIEMKLMDGMEAASKIRQKDKAVIIIFITNLAQYAIQGYEVEAKGFLLKPVKKIALEQQLTKNINEIKQKREAFLTVNFAGGMKKLPVSDICYMESEGHYLVIHTIDETFRILSSLKDMEKKLENNHFCRCNNGTLVNLYHVKSVEQNDLRLAQETISISRGRKKAFMEALTDYIGGGGMI